ncbi:DNA repair protein RecN [bacterium BMS3Abin07]|nr:DNA repair protein RecN [bacterium BMS3Abin07]GBE31421.1 DNA repair protein RecN [bacterium BMS3Bbin05]
MLRELKIKNFAIVDSLTVEFHPGLNILTGETGAGKSIIIGAIEMLLGARAQGEMIKSGADSAELQAFFDIHEAPVLEKLGIDASEGVIVRRIISGNGRGRVYINDILTNVKSLEEFGRYLVDIHGQHDHQRLTAADRQLEFIDLFGRLEDLIAEYRTAYDERHRLEDELFRLGADSKERARRLDLLKFQINEIESADISPGEINGLEEERKILFNSARLRELCEDAYGLLYNGESAVVDNINTVISNLRTISEYDSSADEPVELLNSAAPLINDSAASVRDMRDRYNADPERLDAVERRLDTLRGLCRKYGETEEEVMDYLNSTKFEFDELMNSDEKIEELRERYDEIKKRLSDTAKEISAKRKDAAAEVQKLVSKRLGKLAFDKAVFRIDVIQRRDEKGEKGFGPKGCDIVEFLFSANPSEPPRPLKKVASGGELSRVMLAIKSVFADIDDTPVMVFDEIDAGIGGNTAISVGEALKGLSANRQVLCITHLAQIASKADFHFSIEKHQKAKKVDIDVKLLDRNERLKEIARLLSGKVTPASLKHSEELLAK